MIGHNPASVADMTIKQIEIILQAAHNLASDAAKEPLHFATQEEYNAHMRRVRMRKR